MDKLKRFKRIVPKQPPYLIIEQIMNLIADNHLLPGDKLPSEADLQKVMHVSRAQVHDAITLLERNGILIAKPQSGTYLRDFGKHILMTLMKNILDSREDLNPEHLMEMRMLIETTAIREAAQKAEPHQIAELWELHNNYLSHQQSSEEAIDDDLYFHYRILELSDNQVLKSQFCNLLPDIIFLTRKQEEHYGRENRMEETCSEHEDILKKMEARDPDSTSEALRYHLKQVMEDSRKLGEIPRD